MLTHLALTFRYSKFIMTKDIRWFGHAFASYDVCLISGEIQKCYDKHEIQIAL